MPSTSTPGAVWALYDHDHDLDASANANANVNLNLNLKHVHEHEHGRSATLALRQKPMPSCIALLAAVDTGSEKKPMIAVSNATRTLLLDLNKTGGLLKSVKPTVYAEYTFSSDIITLTSNVSERF